MFDLLKKKISGFVKGITEAVGAREEPKAEEKIAPVEKEIIAPVETPTPVEKEIIAPVETPAIEKEIAVEAPKPVEVVKPVAAETPKPTVAPKTVEAPKTVAVPKPVEKPPAETQKPTIAPKATEAPKTFAIPKPAVIPAVEKRRDIAPDLGLFSKLKGMLTNQVEITESETRAMFDELEMALLESDVSSDTAQALVLELKKSLVGKKVAKSEVEKTINGAIADAITSVFTPAPDIIALAREKKAKGEVLKIMFLGPNGAGKTTTIAKLASLFKQNGLDVVISASDTFRAAAIEQAAIHADRIGVKLVKQSYGADPAAVAFDAIKHAQSAGAAVVLIDTAGRQETNRNLIEEMKKIDRVAKPDFKIFIGEALAGHVLVEQVKSFDAAVGVDGIILTKLDCDAKGGNSISIAHDAAKPIMFFGVGQEYGDLVPFDPGYIAAKVLEA